MSSNLTRGTIAIPKNKPKTHAIENKVAQLRERAPELYFEDVS
ncbi:hypothetical protein [Mobiluncus mulieris]|nr:hypothetical protein [Mobiluncus mulieris]